MNADVVHLTGKAGHVNADAVQLTGKAGHVTADAVGVAAPVFDQLQPFLRPVQANVVQV